MAMKRTKKSAVANKGTVVKNQEPAAVEEKLLKFRKKPGGGSFRMANKKIIKPNQVFEAYSREIPKAFRDQVECLEPSIENEPLEVVDTGFRIAAAEEEGKFNVLNSYDKILNEEPLTREAAEKLITELD